MEVDQDADGTIGINLALAIPHQETELARRRVIKRQQYRLGGYGQVDLAINDVRHANGAVASLVQALQVLLEIRNGPSPARLFFLN
jgi:hypothetical protein